MRYTAIIFFSILISACANKKAELPIQEPVRVQEEARTEAPTPDEESPSVGDDRLSLKASDLAVADGAGRSIALINGKHEEMVSLLGPPLSDGPMYPEDYASFHANPTADISSVQYLHTFIGTYKGLFFEYIKETDELVSLEIEESVFRTPRGITVGSSADDVVHSYGEPSSVFKSHRKKPYNWMRPKYAYPNVIYAYSIDLKVPDHLGGGASIFFFIDESNIVELIKLVNEN